MKVAVLGAGVVGTATAYYLACDGHEVTLIDRRSRPATEASAGNAGLVSPSDAYAWASPDALRMAIKSLYRSDLGVKYKLRLDPQLWIWSLKFLAQCNSSAAQRNTLLKLQLLSYSKTCLNQIIAETGIEYDQLANGIIYYFRSLDGLKAADRHMSILRDHGIQLEIVDRDRMLEIEPVLKNAPKIEGAIYSPDCQTGDSHMFANRLADWCVAEKGTNLLLDTGIHRMVAEEDRLVRVETTRGAVEADSFVLAAGAESVFLARNIGINLPIYPVKGFSMTVPILRPDSGPHMGVVDEDRLVAMSPFGNRLRAAASAIFSGYDYSFQPRDFASIIETVRDLFGDAVDLNAARYWTGLRPMTPSSVPILGPSRYANLFLNVGHGHVGWSMACGSGRFVADWINGQPTAIDSVGYTAA